MENSKFNAIKYKNDYDREHYDKVLLSFPKGTKEQLKMKAARAGKTMSQYVLDLVERDD